VTAVATYWMPNPLTRDEAVYTAERENDLVRRCRHGDTAAFQAIYQKYRAQIFRVVSRTVLNQADREEVTQDVFLQVFKSLSSFQGSAKLSTWIHRVAVNVTLQHLRKKRSRIKLLFSKDTQHEATDRLPSPAASSPEERYAQKERQAAVEQALAKLSEKKRVALVLHDFEGLPAKEIAEIVSSPVLTVRTRVFYARKEFYERLASEPAFGDFSLSAGKSEGGS